MRETLVADISVGVVAQVGSFCSWLGVSMSKTDLNVMVQVLRDACENESYIFPAFNEKSAEIHVFGRKHAMRNHIEDIQKASSPSL